MSPRTLWVDGQLVVNRIILIDSSPIPAAASGNGKVRCLLRAQQQRRDWTGVYNVAGRFKCRQFTCSVELSAAVRRSRRMNKVPLSFRVRILEHLA